MGIVKSAPILLIFGVKKQLTKRFFFLKFEQNRSIFDEVQKFGPRSKFLKLVRFCSNFGEKNLLVSCFHTPNMSKIGALLTMPKILDPIFLTIRKINNPKLKYVARKWLICLKNCPKVLGNIGHCDPFLTGTPYFRWLKTAAVPKRLGLGPKFFRLRNHHTG